MDERFVWLLRVLQANYRFPPMSAALEGTHLGAKRKCCPFTPPELAAYYIARVPLPALSGVMWQPSLLAILASIRTALPTT